ncbi:Uncharacterised protein [Vibrio cholerae]|nr:Uncharacterised protein [Vibrio cholerae]
MGWYALIALAQKTNLTLCHSLAQFDKQCQVLRPLVRRQIAPCNALLNQSRFGLSRPTIGLRVTENSTRSLGCNSKGALKRMRGRVILFKVCPFTS